jgi:hypothetical protein
MKYPIPPVPLKTGLRWQGGGGFIYEQKMDGKFHVFSVGGGIVCGEKMRNGTIYAFDIVSRDGIDVRGLPLGERLRELTGLIAQLRPKGVLRPATGQGGEFLEHVIASGGEGVVSKDLSAPFGHGQFKCKRQENFTCLVTGLREDVGAVELADLATGENRGAMPLKSGFNLVRIGSVLKVVAFGLLASGKLREARPDNDAPGSWLIKF